MPFGVKSAPEEFQRRVHEELEGLKGIFTIADDVVVYGSGDTDEQALEDHNKNLHALLERARQRNIKFNMNKCKIGLKEVKYMGHVLSSDGLKADPDKISAVSNMKEPQNKEEAQRFLGFINYLSKFLPGLSEVAVPIRTLIKEDVKWTWQELHSLAFKKLVNMVTNSPTLQYYNKDSPVTLQCDASQFGLGASLLQNGKPVSYISRTLNPTECHYAQIEKECLAVLFAFERFEQYLFGKCDITVETDHKPLETIFKKPLVNAPKRLQRMLLRLQKFTFTVVYRPGKTMLLADFLSRAPETKYECSMQDNSVMIFETSMNSSTKEFEQCKSLEYINVTDERLNQLKEHTYKDPVLQKLIPVIINGWPNRKTQVPKELWNYWPFKEELGVEDGLVLKGERIVIPSSMTIELVHRIHFSHQGVESCIRRAKDVFFWPGMAGDIRKEVEKCLVCKKYAPTQRKEHLLLQETPSRPWQRMWVDFAQEGSTHFIIVTDYYSSFFEIRKTQKCTSESLIVFCKELFARYGIPDIVVGDSGTPILSQAFKDFSEEWKFKIITSSPYHHQANGKVESAVKIFKSILKKVREDKGDVQQALLELRNTPLKEIGKSPAQLLMSRRTKSFVPTCEDLLRPNVPVKVIEKWDKKKDAYKTYFDKGAKDLAPLIPGQVVWVQRKPQERRDPWVEATESGWSVAAWLRHHSSHVTSPSPSTPCIRTLQHDVTMRYKKLRHHSSHVTPPSPSTPCIRTLQHDVTMRYKKLRHHSSHVTPPSPSTPCNRTLQHDVTMRYKKLRHHSSHVTPPSPSTPCIRTLQHDVTVRYKT
ncbi:uncharacterized protein K02A2.6-like [Macrosteles quadrilineatus]|uniref:uncharacterized protein K02A2.6-like n=1 Tax=Macrosteles quadrilineatus TaxID=74068 RepID=UPI0023E1156A|nr:uncharacterized protein K02A2.6-like [Macrosteles quadrilineatus]